MDPSIIVAIIMATGTIITQLIIASSNKKATAKIIDYRVGQLEKKVEKHNNFVERITKLEVQTENNTQRIITLEREE